MGVCPIVHGQCAWGGLQQEGRLKVASFSGGCSVAFVHLLLPWTVDTTCAMCHSSTHAVHQVIPFLCLQSTALPSATPIENSTAGAGVSGCIGQLCTSCWVHWAAAAAAAAPSSSSILLLFLSVCLMQMSCPHPPTCVSKASQPLYISRGFKPGKDSLCPTLIDEQSQCILHPLSSP